MEEESDLVRQVHARLRKDFRQALMVCVTNATLLLLAIVAFVYIAPSIIEEFASEPLVIPVVAILATATAVIMVKCARYVILDARLAHMYWKHFKDCDDLSNQLKDQQASQPDHH